MDDTELYKTKVKYILENDIEDMDLTFSDEEYSHEGHLVKVIFVTFSFNKPSTKSSTSLNLLLNKYRNTKLNPVY